jgi:RNA polymerase subunit RPABC4/transcription elongation factor Spt4
MTLFFLILAAILIYYFFIYRDNGKYLFFEVGKRCPNCKNIVKDSFNVCPICKETLKKKCVHCGERINVEWKFCPYCENKVNNGENK